MANTVVQRTGSRFLTVAVQSAVAPIENWDSRTLFPGGMRIMSISMTPTAIGDACVIADGTPLAAGELFSNVALAIGQTVTRYYPGVNGKGVLCTPVIYIALSVGNYGITFELA